MHETLNSLTVRKHIVSFTDFSEPGSCGHHIGGVPHRVESRRQHLELGLNLLRARRPRQLQRLVVGLLLLERHLNFNLT